MITQNAQEFVALFNSKDFSLLGIDYGEKKIGIAVGHTAHWVAMPYKVLDAKTFDIIKILNECRSDCCVIGVGYFEASETLELLKTIINQKDNTLNINQQSPYIRFILSIASLNLPILLQHEHCSSRLASSMLKNIGFNKEARKQQDDAHAAAIMLQDALNAIKMVM